MSVQDTLTGGQTVRRLSKNMKHVLKLVDDEIFGAPTFMPISVEQRNGETWKMKVAATVFEPLLEELPPLPFLFSATLRAPVFVRGLSSHRSYQRLWSGTYMELPLWSYEVINYIYKWIAPMVLPSKHGYSPPQGDPWDPHRLHRSMCLRTSLASNPLWPKASAVLPQRDTQNPGVL